MPRHPTMARALTVTATYTVVAAYPVPSISSLAPAIGTAGGTAFTLTITGSNFVSSSTAYWGSTALTTQYVSATQLTAQVTAAQIAAAGTGAITVQSPAPGGGTSNTFQFEIDSAGSATPPLFTGSTGSVAPGSTATYSVTLPSSATGVSVTCLNLPTGASCSYSAGTLTIVTTSSAHQPAPIRSRPSSLKPFPAPRPGSSSFRFFFCRSQGCARNSKKNPCGSLPLWRWPSP